MEIFLRGSEIATEHGLILVDTKYEYGKRDGKIYLIDEINTPDSSRYFMQKPTRKDLIMDFPRSSCPRNL